MRSAILASAVDIASSGGPLSARAIARRAGVNHGQVHHLFAGKGGLHRAVLEHLAALLDARLATQSRSELAPAALEATLNDPRFVRFLAAYLIEYPDDAVPQESFPVVRRLAEAFGEPEGTTNRAKLGCMLAAGLGWALFRPWIQAALNLTEDEAAQVEAIITEVQQTS